MCVHICVTYCRWTLSPSICMQLVVRRLPDDLVRNRFGVLCLGSDDRFCGKVIADWPTPPDPKPELDHWGWSHWYAMLLRAGAV